MFRAKIDLFSGVWVRVLFVQAFSTVKLIYFLTGVRMVVVPISDQRVRLGVPKVEILRDIVASTEAAQLENGFWELTGLCTLPSGAVIRLRRTAMVRDDLYLPDSPWDEINPPQGKLWWIRQVYWYCVDKRNVKKV